jgi:hypothetical protein
LIEEGLRPHRHDLHDDDYLIEQEEKRVPRSHKEHRESDARCQEGNGGVEGTRVGLDLKGKDGPEDQIVSYVVGDDDS